LQTPENKPLTKSKADSEKPQSENLALSLFLELELDADLKQVIEAWPRLSVELRQAIVKMVR